MVNIAINKLAWDLVDRLGRRLSDHERMAVFVDLGSGDEAGAIGRLLHIAAQHGYSLPAKMVDLLRLWARAHDVETRYEPIFAVIESAAARQAGVAAMRTGLRRKP